MMESQDISSGRYYEPTNCAAVHTDVCKFLRIVLPFNFNFPKGIPADSILQQMRHFRKRAPLVIGWQVFHALPGAWLFIP
jgi:hypothetical protein